MDRPLRVGVLLDGGSIRAWQHRALAELALEPGVRLDVAVWLAGAPVPTTRGLAVRAYERLDRAVFRFPNDPLSPVAASDLLGDLASIVARAISRPGGFELDSGTLAELRARDLDVLLQLGGGSLGGDVLDVARLGLWSFAHDELARRGGVPFLAEITSAAETTETLLVARSSGGTRVLLRSFSSTDVYSLHRNRTRALWKAALLPARASAAFAAGRSPPFDGSVPEPAYHEPPARGQNGFAVARHGAKMATRVVRNRARMRLRDRVWFIAVRRRGTLPIDADPLAGFQPIPCPEDRFHADPMLVEVGGEHHLFFEDADRQSGIGAISWCAIRPDGSPGPVRRVLEGDAHLSYPFVFPWRGAFYMIPETSEKRTVELYRATDFPLRWQLEKVLFRDVAAVDTTIFEHHGRLWLFTAMSPSGGSLNDELFLLHADDVGGDWVPHPMNPIVSDVRRARPAGPLFWEGSTLYRPGQDCAADYGAAFWMNRVDVLDEKEYRETPVRRIDASWWPGGVCSHTYTRAGDFEAMDNRVWLARGAAWRPRQDSSLRPLAPEAPATPAAQPVR